MAATRLEEILQLPRLTELCIKYSATRLGAFGSVLGEDFKPESDIDLIVEFGHTETFSPLKQYFGFLEELESMYGRRVDLVERKAIRNPYFRESILIQEVEIFAA